jgi:hypothetical protein
VHLDRYGIAIDIFSSAAAGYCSRRPGVGMRASQPSDRPKFSQYGQLSSKPARDATRRTQTQRNCERCSYFFEGSCYIHLPVLVDIIGRYAIR